MTADILSCRVAPSLSVGARYLRDDGACITTTQLSVQTNPAKGCTTLHCPYTFNTSPNTTASVSVSLRWSQPWALQKWTNKSRCRTGYGLARAQRTKYYVVIQISPRDGAIFFFGRRRHLPAHCKVYKIYGIWTIFSTLFSRCSSNVAFHCQYCRN